MDAEESVEGSEGAVFRVVGRGLYDGGVFEEGGWVARGDCCVGGD